MADRCSFCGSTAGPFNEVGGLFTLLMCADCQAARGHGSGPFPVMTRAQMRAGLDLLPTWALEQKAAANRQVIAVMRTRLAAREQVARMYQEPGLAWLERQAEVAQDLAAAAMLRDRWANGQYEFDKKNLRDTLNRNLRRCDRKILSEGERPGSTPVFGLTDGDLPAGTRLNRGFFPMWNRFNDTVLRFLMSDGNTEASRRTKKEGIRAATMDLQSNLAEHMTEVDIMRIANLHKQLRRELKLLKDPAVVKTVAPGGTTWWEVVERLTDTPQDGDSPIFAYALAKRRNSIFKWVEKFKKAVSGPRFDKMVNGCPR
jgi:hypothetical protein